MTVLAHPPEMCPLNAMGKVAAARGIHSKTLLDLPQELLKSIFIHLHPNKLKCLTRLNRQARIQCRIAGFGSVQKHLIHYVTAETSRCGVSHSHRAGIRKISAFDRAEFEMLQSIAWFHLDSNYITALMLLKGGITDYTISILLPEFSSLSELPPQPHPDISPILRAFAEALERGLSLPVPEPAGPLISDTALWGDESDLDEEGEVDKRLKASIDSFPSAFVFFWLTTVDAVDVFADLVRRWGGDSSSYSSLGTDQSGFKSLTSSTSSNPLFVSTTSHTVMFLLRLGIQSASIYGSLAILRHLLDLGVDPRQEDNYAIKLASEIGHANCVSLLLSTGLVDPSAEEGYALGMAAQNGHEDVVKLLLGSGTVRADEDEDYALRYATANGHVEIVRMLLETGECDPGACDFFALREASRLGYREVLDALLASGVYY
ncbi:hypothetical protein HDU67_003147 [Dinochytrium kinnereticum]|nr:hypothetical protein HDU67_003147 [Dinochytrium kinnereticum]